MVTCECHARQDQGYASEHYGCDALAKGQPACRHDLPARYPRPRSGHCSGTRRTRPPATQEV